jgi:hypothetical protein
MYDSQPANTMVLRCLTLNHYINPEEEGNNLTFNQEEEDNNLTFNQLLRRRPSGKTPDLDKTDPFQQ